MHAWLVPFLLNLGMGGSSSVVNLVVQTHRGTGRPPNP